jgi:Mrp family chromosome partitioning ATPase
MLEVFAKTDVVRDRPADRDLAAIAKPNLQPADDETIPYVEVGERVAKSRPASVVVLPASVANAAPPPAPAEAHDPAWFGVRFQPLAFEPLTGPIGNRFARDLIAYHEPSHAISDQYRILQNEVARQVGSRTGMSLLFASARPSAGTTAVTLNLAITWARASNAKIVVVDANFAHPDVSARVGVRGSPGLRDVVARIVPLPWAVQETGETRLSVLTAGTDHGTAALEGVPAVIDQLSQRFDWILIDGPTWSEHPEASPLPSMCDATFLVVRRSEMDSPAVADFITTIPRRGGRLLGSILTER